MKALRSNSRRLKIAYFFDWKMDPYLGVPKKVLTQCSNWEKFNHKVLLVAIIPIKMKSRWDEAEIQAEFFCYKTPAGRVFARAKAARYVRSRNFHVVYMRLGILTPAQMRMIRSNDTFLELNTISKYEAKNWGVIQRILFNLSEHFSLRHATGLLAVTPEIEKYYSSHHPKIPIANFPNSIDFGVNSPLSTPKNAKPNLVFVGSENRPWHGIDKLEQLAQKLPEYDFHVIGATNKKIDQENLYLHPPLYNQDLLSFLTKMDVAISSLAMNRTAMLQASPLKTRLYLLCGLPVIAGYIETACQENDEYFLFLGENFDPNSELVLKKIREFVTKWKGQRIPSELVKHLHPTLIEQRRVEFILQTMASQNFSKN